jgi:xanthine dehydrogenase accessory factor
MDIYEQIVNLKKEGRPCALATIVQCSGSSPQKEGAKMLVLDDGSTKGTLGGGCIESEVRELSLASLRDGVARTVPFNLTDTKGGLVCGGKIHVFIEPLLPDPHLVILGAGHVGKALSSIAKFAGFRVTVADDRARFANAENIPDADKVVACEFFDAFSKIATDANSYIVIATRGHNHDLDAIKAALGTGVPYIGLVGSGRKRAVLFNLLREAGFQPSDISRIVTPVGLAIGSVTPEEIAVSIIAQIIEIRRKNVPSGIGHSSCSGFFAENGAVKTASAS